MQAAQFAIETARAAPIEPDLVALLRGLIDLTYLGEDDDSAVDELCAKAAGVAAVCVYPEYIARAKNKLEDKKIKIATVVNFPHGNSSLDTVLQEIDTATALHADEIDVVLPYQDFVNGQFHTVNHFLTAVRKRCGNKIVKIIIESGALLKPALIRLAGQMVIDSGADFIKTSTGKIEVGATLAAAYTLLTLIEQSKSSAIGLKLSGGIRSVADAHAYLYLARAVMGKAWLNPRTLRIGASRLIDDLS
jgi:deoxyribose-phosphate aldolase